jgi:hypothetical protein
LLVPGTTTIAGASKRTFTPPLPGGAALPMPPFLGSTILPRTGLPLPPTEVQDPGWTAAALYPAHLPDLHRNELIVEFDDSDEEGGAMVQPDTGPVQAQKPASKGGTPPLQSSHTVEFLQLRKQVIVYVL